MAEQQPDDVMVWYGLASEYTRAERWNDAERALRHVVSLNPDYTAAYQMLGTALKNEGRTEEARAIWTEGVRVAARTGAWKAGQHMEGLLAEGEENPPGPEFCE